MPSLACFSLTSHFFNFFTLFASNFLHIVATTLFYLFKCTLFCFFSFNLITRQSNSFLLFYLKNVCTCSEEYHIGSSNLTPMESFIQVGFLIYIKRGRANRRIFHRFDTNSCSLSLPLFDFYYSFLYCSLSSVSFLSLFSHPLLFCIIYSFDL